MTDEPWWHSDAAPGDDQLGSAAEEAGRLFAAMRDRMLADPKALRMGLRMMEAFTSLSRGAGTPVAPGGAPECAYCPVCQAIVRARSVRPDTVERLTGAAIEFAETVRQVVVHPADPADDHLRHVPLDDWLDRQDSAADAGEPGAEVDDGRGESPDR